MREVNYNARNDYRYDDQKAADYRDALLLILANAYDPLSVEEIALAALEYRQPNLDAYATVRRAEGP